MRRLLERRYDPVLGFETRTYFDDATGKLIVQRLQDVEGTLNHNKAQYNSFGDHARFSKGDMHKMASIPLSIYEEWRKEGFDVLTGDDKELRRRLNDPKNRFLRTKPGRL